MTAPIIQHATSEDLRSISSQTLYLIKRLPFLCITAVEPDVMRTWGVAMDGTVSDTERLYPGALLAPQYTGETASRGYLLYNGAVPVAAFMPPNAASPN